MSWTRSADSGRHCARRAPTPAEHAPRRSGLLFRRLSSQQQRQLGRGQSRPQRANSTSSENAVEQQEKASRKQGKTRHNANTCSMSSRRLSSKQKGNSTRPRH
eukprot:5737403-Pyramimonas_sp.AAC.1